MVSRCSVSVRSEQVEPLFPVAERMFGWQYSCSSEEVGVSIMVGL